MTKLAVTAKPVLMFVYSILLGLQDPSCSAQNNDVFMPSPKVKTLEPMPTASTPLPVTERNLWGLSLWQVVGFAFVATILLITFCCCLCDCRIPKTGYEKEDESKRDSDCSDTEPAAAPSKPPQEGKKLVNGSGPQVTQEQKTQNTGHTPGEVNKAFDNEEGTVPQTESWRGIQRVTLSREP